MSDEWIYRRAPAERSHVSLLQLRQFVGAGYLQPFDLVRREGSADWVPLSTVTELASGLEDLVLDEADWQSEAPNAAPSGDGESPAGTPPRPTRIAIGGLIFDERWEQELRARRISDAGQSRPQPLNPTIDRSRRNEPHSKRRMAAAIAAIALVSLSLLGAMGDLRQPDHHDGDSASVAGAAPAPTTSPSPTASDSKESFQNQILGDWKGVSEPMSLTFQRERAILAKDGRLFQILPYTLNASDGTACLDEGGGKTIPLKLGQDNRLYSQNPDTDKEMVFARQ